LQLRPPNSRTIASALADPPTSAPSWRLSLTRAAFSDAPVSRRTADFAPGGREPALQSLPLRHVDGRALDSREEGLGDLSGHVKLVRDPGHSSSIAGHCHGGNDDGSALGYPDSRIEYRAITDLIPPFPTSIQPAQKDRSWIVTLTGGGAVGRVSLVDVNTKRVYGEFTMPSGLMRSFIVPPEAAGQDTTSVYYNGFLDTCFLYDQAVALVAFLTLGEQPAAAKLVDALLTIQSADGSFPFSSGQATLYDRSSAGFIRIGAVAWVCYALLLCDQPQFQPWFETPTTNAAKACLDSILDYVNSIGTVNGGRGRYVDGAFDPSCVVPWWSVEHNIDTWWCLDLADQLYGSGAVDYRAAADLMKAALLTTGYGWDDTDGIFWQGGTASAGSNTPDGMHALDTHSWGATLLAKWTRVGDAKHSLDRANQFYYVTDPPTGLSGYTTFTPVDGYPDNTVMTPWYEGSFGVEVTYRVIDQAQADLLMQRLVKGQRSDGSYLYALQDDPVNDIHDWPCIIASAWNILAWSGPGTPHARIVWPVP
jgi:hypothetical protein